MPDSKITALTSISTSTDPANDPLVIVDVSDTSMAATGTTKKVTLNQLLGASGTATLASATITGDLTVNSNVNVGASPAFYGGKIATNGSIAIAGGNYLKLWNSTGTGVAGINAGAADTLTFSLTNAFTTAMTLNATGLGVGGPPAAGMLLTVGGTSSVSATANALQVLSSKGTFNVVTDGSTNAAGTTITYSWANGGQGPLIFRNASISNVMTLDASGNCGIGVTPSAGGGCLQLKSGITFPATQVASSDPNTLDDYEEGSWTPVVADASTGGNTGTCTINSAKYVKIGRQVSVQCDISGITTTGMTAGNPFYIRGLPFTSVQGGDGNFYTYRVGRDAATVSASAHVSDASSVVGFFLYTTNSATTDKTLIVSNIVSTTSQIILSVTYFV